MTLWYELAAKVPPALVEQVSRVLREASPGGIAVEEPVDLLGPEKGFTVRTEEAVTLKAYVPVGELGAVIVDKLRHRMESFPGVEIVAKPVQQADWETSWREFFGVVDPGGRVVVVPSWIDHEAPSGVLVLRIDPGQAFGTGHHETTRLCLAALEGAISPGDRFLDIGTGSGILSIAAIRLGAESGVALDTDPIAVEVARANCATNSVAERVQISLGTLDGSDGDKFDVVVANVFADPLIRMAPAFALVVRSAGRLILSGVVASDSGRVLDAMASVGFQCQAMRYESDWCALEFSAENG